MEMWYLPEDGCVVKLIGGIKAVLLELEKGKSLWAPEVIFGGRGTTSMAER